MAIHGGAGAMPIEAMPPGGIAAARLGLREALLAGWEVFRHGGAAVDAVEAAVISMEDCEVFNAGRGAVFNAAEEHELDAAIMDGATLKAGAAAQMRTVRNPISAARAVMDLTDCVLMAGESVDRLAREAGLPIVQPHYFSTELRRTYLRNAKAAAKGEAIGPLSDADKHGTVGAVACDRQGNLAAATSTGGVTNKRPGRIGDTPVIGAGTYARNGRCAVSCTGQGEYFIREVAGHELAARMAYRGDTLQQAANDLIHRDLAPRGGRGGLVAIDGAGNVSLPFNTAGMYRGVLAADGNIFVGIYGDDFRLE